MLYLYSTCQQVVSFYALGSLENQSSGIGESLERVIILFPTIILFLNWLANHFSKLTVLSSLHFVNGINFSMILLYDYWRIIHKN